MFSEILPILKAPVTRVKAIADSNNPAVGIEFIATKMVVCLIFLLIVLLKIRGAVSGYSSYLNIKIPYFKSILCVILATAGIDVIDAVFLKVITALLWGKSTLSGIYRCCWCYRYVRHIYHYYRRNSDRNRTGNCTGIFRHSGTFGNLYSVCAISCSGRY